MKKFNKILLSLLLPVLLLTGCRKKVDPEPTVTPSATPVVTVEPTLEPTSAPTEDTLWIDENGTYDTKDEVALYLYLYDHLPDNYMTKKEARALGWSSGALHLVVEGMCIGGDRFGNNEGLLPEADGRQYYECDIDTLSSSKRGAKRIVYSNDGLIYYTEDHYDTFVLLYGEEPAE